VGEPQRHPSYPSDDVPEPRRLSLVPSPPLSNEELQPPHLTPSPDDRPGGARIPENLAAFFGVGALVGAALLGLTAYLASAGVIALGGSDQVVVSGVATAVFAGAGAGVAIGALAGGIVALALTSPSTPPDDG
jgi:hypothetical protein